MQTYDFNTANQGSLIAAGTLVAYVSGTSTTLDDGIIIRPERGGSAVELQPGQSFTFTERFQQLRIAPRATGATVTGKLLTGEGQFTNNRAAGDINVIDNGKTRTLSDLAFLAPVNAGGLAANLAHVQFFNTSANQRAVVNQIIVSGVNMTAAGSIFVRQNNTQLTSAFGAAISKLVGSTTTFGLTRLQYNATALGTALAEFGIAQNGQAIYKFTEPVIVPPSQGLILVSSQLAAGLSATFELFVENV